jgi:hypothetical protein
MKFSSRETGSLFLEFLKNTAAEDQSAAAMEIPPFQPVAAYDAICRGRDD